MEAADSSVGEEELGPEGEALIPGTASELAARNAVAIREEAARIRRAASIREAARCQ